MKYIKHIFENDQSYTDYKLETVFNVYNFLKEDLHKNYKLDRLGLDFKFEFVLHLGSGYGSKVFWFNLEKEKMNRKNYGKARHNQYCRKQLDNDHELSEYSIDIEITFTRKSDKGVDSITVLDNNIKDINILKELIFEIRKKYSDIHFTEPRSTSHDYYMIGFFYHFKNYINMMKKTLNKINN